MSFLINYDNFNKMKKEDDTNVLSININNLNHNKNNDLNCDLMLTLLFNNKHINSENGSFSFDEKFSDRFPLLDKVLNQVTYEDVEGLEGLAYIVNHNGVKTVYFKTDISRYDFLELQKKIGLMGVKPINVVGSVNNIMDYKTLIDPNVMMYKREHPNLSIHMLSTGFGLLLLNEMINLKEKMKLAKKYLQRKKIMKSMYSDYNFDEDEELKKIAKKLTKDEEINLKKNDRERLDLFKDFVKNNIDKIALSDEIKLDIKKSIDSGYLLSEVATPMQALSNVILNHLNLEKDINMIVKSYKFNNNNINSSLEDGLNSSLNI